MMVDWSEQPELILVLDKEHPDYEAPHQDQAHMWSDEFLTPEEAHELAHKRSEEGLTGRFHTVGDSREGWAKAVEMFENATFRRSQGESALDYLILDFSEVREKGAPIRGMQNRPASGPVPLMHGLRKVTELKDQGLPAWESNLIVDHELAAIVAVGGVRRAARIAVKNWRDEGIFDYIEFKRKLENRTPFGLYYWSSNNSIGVDEEFWSAVQKGRRLLEARGESIDDYVTEDVIGYKTTFDVYEEKPDNPVNPWTDEPLDVEEITGAVYDLIEDDHPIATKLSESERRALNVYIASTACSFFDRTGEPGFINLDQLSDNRDGLEEMLEALIDNPDDVIGYGQFTLSSTSQEMYHDLGEKALKKQYPFLVNPCSEIVLLFTGGYCIIGSVNGANAVRDYTEIGELPDEILEKELTHLAEVQTRFLMRINQLPALYQGEVDRTQRIGVGLCSPHEIYLFHYGLSFEDVVDEEVFEYLTMKRKNREIHPLYNQRNRTDAQHRAIEYWELLGRVSYNGVRKEANRYAEELGVRPPHTSTMIAPNGTTSKLYNTTEGAHLPAMRQYLRNVQFDPQDPVLAEYKAKGYPTHELQQYKGKTIVGFPTKPFITTKAEELGVRDKITTAAEASADEQYRWLKLMERYWIEGGGRQPGNQVSYSLKFNPAETDFATYDEALFSGQRQVRCCSVIVQEKTSPDPYGIVESVTGEKPKAGEYEYLPEQAVPQEVYQIIESRINRDEETAEDIGREHVECEGEACPITFRD
jgi:hypothetical protein